MKAYRTLRTVCQGECRYIIGDPNGPDTLYCGDPTLPRKSWCAVHANKVFATTNKTALERDDENLARWVEFTEQARR